MLKLRAMGSIVRADKVEERRQEKETMQKDVKTAEERAGNPEKASAREGKTDRDEGRVSFKQKLPEMKEKAAEQTKANPIAENAKKRLRRSHKTFLKQVLRADSFSCNACIYFVYG